jgi:hypothetical protein
MTSSSLLHLSVKTGYSEQQNTAWQAAIKSDALRKRQQSISEDTSLPLDNNSKQLVTTIPTGSIFESSSPIGDRIQLVTTITSSIPTRRQVCEKFTLNAEQARAFHIVCRHADGESHLKIGKKKRHLFSFSY